MSEIRTKILLQLIGDQAQPNAICIKSVKPQIAVNIYTAKTKETAEHLEKFRSDYLPEIQFRSEQLDSDFPSVGEIKSFFERIFTDYKNVENAEYIVNYTGGTKPMSIGAFLAGREHGATLLYVQSANEFREGENLEPCTRWQPASLSIEETLVIEGTAIQDSVELSSRRIAMAHEIKNLRKKEKDDKELRGKRFCFYPAHQEKDFNKESSRIEEYFKKSLAFGACRGGLFNKLIAFCQEEGWLNADSAISAELLGDFEKLKSVNAFLDGGWWEVLVAEAFKRIAPGDNTRWSVTAAGKVEDDVLAVIDGRLFVVSCKAGNDQKGFMSEFHRVADRAKKLGGINAVPVFARYGFLSDEMKGYANELKIPVIFPHMLWASKKDELKKELTRYLLNP